MKKNFSDDRQDVLIRQMKEADQENLIKNYCSPWHSLKENVDFWKAAFKEQSLGIRTIYIIEKSEEILGYGSLLRKSEYPFFVNVPEINSVWIVDKYRRSGFGTLLIQHLEELAKKEGFKMVGIGVGLYKDYGPAQKLYFQLGYKPDGHGITHNCHSVVKGKHYPIDDELILWLTKAL
jgi:GNAT superfamily N-acetyltransferase